MEPGTLAKSTTSWNVLVADPLFVTVPLTTQAPAVGAQAVKATSARAFSAGSKGTETLGAMTDV